MNRTRHDYSMIDFTTAGYRLISRGTSRRIARYVLAVGLLLISPLAVGAADLNWDGNCGDPPPQRWHCRCSEPNHGTCNGGGTSNWVSDGVPGAADNATIAPGSGKVDLDTNTTVSSVNAGSGLILGYSDLTINGAGSSIKGLELFGGGTLFVNDTVNLIGPSQVRREVYGPGTLVSNGEVDLSNARLNDMLVFRNQGNANVSTVNLILNGRFENEGSLELASDRCIVGSGLFMNSGELTYTGPGTSACLDPPYEQTAGNLDVQVGRLRLRSVFIDLAGGSVNIADGAVLTITCPFGGPWERRFNGLSEVTGGGLLDVKEDMTIAAPVTMSLGQGDPFTGSGGFRLAGSTLTLEADLENEHGHRMRFRGGTLEGAGGTFRNYGHAYTLGGGGAYFRTNARNIGQFGLYGWGMSLGRGAVFINDLNFRIEQGDIFQGPGAQGMFFNNGLLTLHGANPTVDSDISVFFENLGLVAVDVGILRLHGPVGNLQAGVLTGGIWEVYAGGRLEFPGAITTLAGDCRVGLFGGEIPDLASLEFLDESALELGIDHHLSVDGPLTMTDGSKLSVGEGGSFTANGILEIGDPDDSAIPDLASPTGPFKGRLDGLPPPATVTASTIDNGFGRVLPGDRNGVGTLRLVGDYIQGPNGHLHIDLSTGGSDVLAIDGDALVDGCLELNRLGPVTVGTKFTVLTTTGTVSGAFDEIIADDLYSVSYQANSVTVTFEENLADIFSDGFESGDTTAWSSQVP